MTVDRFIRLPEVEARVGMKRSTIYRRIAKGTFPKPRKLAVNISAWPESAINEWVMQMMAATEPPSPET